MLHTINTTKTLLFASAVFLISACDTGYNKESSSSDSSSSSVSSGASSSTSNSSSSASSQAVEPYNSDSIMGLLDANSDYGFFVRIIEAAGLADDLDNPNLTFTVFAATDQGWGFGEGDTGAENSAISQAISNTEKSREFSRYHIIEGDELTLITPTELPQSERVATSGGRELVTTTNTDTVFLNESSYTGTRWEASNGVVYLISKPLIYHDGPNSVFASLNDILSQNRFSNLLTDLETTGLLDVLSADQASYTFFAPTNTAYDELSSEELDALRNEPTTLRQLLDRHLINEQLSSTELFELNGGSKIAAFGNTIDFTIENDWVKANGDNVILPPMSAGGITIYEVNGFIDEGFTYPTP